MIGTTDIFGDKENKIRVIGMERSKLEILHSHMARRKVASVAMSTISVLLIVGFALVKNAIDRDRVTRVGQLLSAMPLGKSGYLFGMSGERMVISNSLTCSFRSLSSISYF
ncbi:hypothetical protein [Paenibacillus sp. NPDC055715]